MISLVIKKGTSKARRRGARRPLYTVDQVAKPLRKHTLTIYRLARLGDPRSTRGTFMG